MVVHWRRTVLGSEVVAVPFWWQQICVVAKKTAIFSSQIEWKIFQMHFSRLFVSPHCLIRTEVCGENVKVVDRQALPREILRNGGLIVRRRVFTVLFSIIRLCTNRRVWTF